jgi:hypothetical protein
MAREPARYTRLDSEMCRVLARTLDDTPETVHALHTLRRGTCRAYVAGDPGSFDGAVVQPIHSPAEPTGFGSAPEVLWDLLQSVEGWTCVLVDSGSISSRSTSIH